MFLATDVVHFQVLLAMVRSTWQLIIRKEGI
jgi:hypothetical protein